MAGELPPDWRERLVGMVLGREPPRSEWFTGGPVCTPDDQLGIYLRQVGLRLDEALLEEVPGLRHLWGDGPLGPELRRRYLAEHPSRSWTLNRIADALPEWLARQPDVPPEQVAMAWLDRAVQRGFDAADGVPLDPAALATVPRLALAPHVSLLRLAHNVHEIRSAALSGEAPPPLRRGEFALVVFRRGLRMRHWAVGAGPWLVLDAIAAGRPLAEAVEEPYRKGLLDPETLAAEVGDWFRAFAERGLLQARGGPADLAD